MGDYAPKNMTDFKALRFQLEALRREHDRDKGAYDQILATIKTDFNCTTVEEAQALVEQYKREAQALAGEIDADTEALQKDYPQLGIDQ